MPSSHRRQHKTVLSCRCRRCEQALVILLSPVEDTLGHSLSLFLSLSLSLSLDRQLVRFFTDQTSVLQILLSDVLRAVPVFHFLEFAYIFLLTLQSAKLLYSIFLKVEVLQYATVHAIVSMDQVCNMLHYINLLGRPTIATALLLVSFFKHQNNPDLACAAAEVYQRLQDELEKFTQRVRPPLPYILQGR